MQPNNVILVQPSVSYTHNSLSWLSYLRSRGNSYGYSRLHAQYQVGQWADGNGEEGDCPLECDCPSLYPRAMYCHSRNLQHVPYVPSRMKYVYLHNNRITSIQQGVFDNATDLVWVILHKNHLRSDKIGKNVFSRLKSLQKLYLDHNNLTSVPQNLPTSLVDLRLNNNNISKLSYGSFQGMLHLQTLRLQRNTIEEVGGALKGLESLALLELGGNLLKKVPESLPEKLQQLYLEYNHITSVSDNFFSQRPSLQFVRLSHNQLTNSGIPTNTFNVSSLVELDLSHNHLEKIPTISTSLENLYLQANHIKEFSVKSFCRVVDVTNYSQIRVLRLDANKIRASDVPPEAVLCLRLATVIDI
uniref:Fibromodulin n=1 Tax=Denticeps clupeoides TaxID=299321 RepID=A0AAY4CWG5_9TELE